MSAALSQLEAEIEHKPISEDSYFGRMFRLIYKVLKGLEERQASIDDRVRLVEALMEDRRGPE